MATTPWRPPGSVAVGNTTLGESLQAWGFNDNFMNVVAVADLGGEFAQIRLETNGIQESESAICYDYPFATDIPSGATIDGVEFRIREFGSNSASKNFYLSAAILTTDGGPTTTGTDQAPGNSNLFPIPADNYTVGGAADLWGATLSRSDVIATGFGALFRIKYDDGSNVLARVSAVDMRVHYTEAGGGPELAAAIGLPSITAAATASIGKPVTASASLPSLTSAAAAEVERSVQAAAALPALTAEGSFGLALDLTAVVGLPPLTADATGSVTKPVTTVATLPSITAAGTATIAKPVSVSVALPGISAAASISGSITPATISFPGAIGPGAQSLGAYTSTASPTVVRVTNRNDTGTGSLRDALEGGADRLVIFDIGGTINLESQIVTAERITVAAATAPEPVYVTGARIQPSSDTIVTDLHVIPGDLSPGQTVGSRDGITHPDGAARVMVAFNTILCAPDETGGSYSNSGQSPATDITWQNNILGEGINSESHPDIQTWYSSGGTSSFPRHDFGPYFASGDAAGGPQRILFARNLVTGVRERGVGSKYPHDMVIAENIFYNLGNKVIECYDLDGSDMAIVANWFEDGPAGTTANASGRKIQVQDDAVTKGTVWVDGNLVNGASDDTVSTMEATLAGSYNVSGGYQPTLTASAAYDLVRSIAGAKHDGSRPTASQRIITYLDADGPATGPGSLNGLGDAGTLVEGITGGDCAKVTLDWLGSMPANLDTSARTDTDSDGIFDAFEAALGVATGSLGPHDLIVAADYGLGSSWDGHRMSTLQTEWARTGEIQKAVSVAATLPAITGSMSAIAERDLTVSASLPAITASASATISKPVTASGTLAPVVASASAILEKPVTAAASLAPITVSTSATLDKPVEISGSLPSISVEMALASVGGTPIVFAASMPAITASVAAVLDKPVAASGVLAPIAATATATIGKTVTASGALAPLTVDAFATLDKPVLVSGALPAISASMNLIPDFVPGTPQLRTVIVPPKVRVVTLGAGNRTVIVR